MGVLFLSVYSVYAETIVLKSGQTVEGKLIEKTDKYIKIDFQGVPLTYYFDEINTINGQKLYPVVVTNELPVSYAQPAKQSSLGLAQVAKNNVGPEKRTLETDSFDDYVKFIKQRFYLLDQQNFKKISCQIEVPLIADLVAKVKQQFVAANIPVKLKENLSDFSLSYTKGVGLRFNKPTFDVEVLSLGAIKNKESFEKGLEQTKAGFAQQIDGVVNILEAVFSDWEIPDRAKETVKSFSEEGGAAKVSLETEGHAEEIVYEGKARTVKFSGTMTGGTDDQLLDDGGFLLLDNSRGHMEQGVGLTMDVLLTIKYQKVQNIVFPSEITQRSTMGMNGVKHESQFGISLKNCSVE